MTLNEKVKLVTKVIELLKVVFCDENVKLLPVETRLDILGDLIKNAQRQIDIALFVKKLVKEDE
jgi:hypothetical protein